MQSSVNTTRDEGALEGDRSRVYQLETIESLQVARGKRRSRKEENVKNIPMKCQTPRDKIRSNDRLPKVADAWAHGHFKREEADGSWIMVIDPHSTGMFDRHDLRYI